MRFRARWDGGGRQVVRQCQGHNMYGIRWCRWSLGRWRYAVAEEPGRVGEFARLVLRLVGTEMGLFYPVAEGS